MTVALFDVQAGFGGARPGQKDRVTAEAWLAEMDRLDIGRSLVRPAPEHLQRDAVRANEALLAACAGTDRLVACPTVIPASGGDLPAEADQVASAVARGAGAAWIRPAYDGWSLRPWHSGPLMEALADRRLPVVCLARMVDADSLADLAGLYAELPFILAEVAYRSHRVIRALLETFDNVVLSMGSNYAVHRGIEDLVGAVGAERVLFGTGFPEVEPMMAVAQLAYADISDEERQLIGSGNLERLTGGIRR